MDVWQSRSNPGRQTALSIGCAAVGLILVIVFRDFGSGANARAGFFLGFLLLLIGMLGLLVNGGQVTVVDPRTRSIIVEDHNLLGARRRVIRFDDIADVSLGYLGKRSGGVEWYYLSLKLRGGGNYALFPPGRFYEGGSDRAIALGWQRRLLEYLGR